jgi:hypothetical protein
MSDKEQIDFEPHFLQYWDKVKDIVDEDGWVYSTESPHILDAYFEYNTGKKIEFQKSYDGEWKGSRWRPKSISE